MIKGYNKAKSFSKLEWLSESINVRNRPCMFLSHKHEDKQSCREIAEYLADSEIDYFLDEEDDSLQTAVRQGNPEKITENIKRGIRESTHMLVVVSDKTYKSQWVPFEIGYGHAAIIDKNMILNERDSKIKLSILTLKDIAETDLPSFMQTGNILRGTKSLNHYIISITGRLEESLKRETKFFSHIESRHPLDEILNWKL
jgi:hypothetical protein